MQWVASWSFIQSNRKYQGEHIRELDHQQIDQEKTHFVIDLQDEQYAECSGDQRPQGGQDRADDADDGGERGEDAGAACRRRHWRGSGGVHRQDEAAVGGGVGGGGGCIVVVVDSCCCDKALEIKEIKDYIACTHRSTCMDGWKLISFWC